MSKVRFTRRLAGVALTAVAVGSCVACSSGGQESSTGGGIPRVTVGSGPATLNAGLPQLVESQKLDEAEGLDATLETKASNSALLLSGLLAGDFDFVNIGALTAATAAAKGQDLVIVGCTAQLLGLVGVRPDVVEDLPARLDSPVSERVKALKGLTIVTTPDGSSYNLALRAMLENYGLDPSKDVTIVPVTDPGAVIAGLKQGTFDAAFFSSAVLANAVESGDASTWIDLPAGDLDEMPSIKNATLLTVATSRKFAEANPDTVDAYYKALVAAGDLVATKPEEAGAVMKQDWFDTLPQNVFDRMWTGLDKVFPAKSQCTKDDIAGTADLLARQPENKSMDFGKVTYENIVWDAAKAKY